MRPSFEITARVAALALGLLMAATAAGASGPPGPPCAAVNEAEVAAVSEDWSRALAAGRLDDLAAFYAEDAVLMAEGMAEPIAGRQRIRDWLGSLAARHAAPQIAMRSIVARCGLASEMAATRFKVTGVRKGTRMFIGGRSSTLWSHDGTRWLIVQQSLPTMLVPNRTL